MVLWLENLILWSILANTSFVDFLYTDMQNSNEHPSTIRSCRVGLAFSSDNFDWNSRKRKTPSGIAVISIYSKPFCTVFCFIKLNTLTFKHNYYHLFITYLVELFITPRPKDNVRNDSRLLNKRVKGGLCFFFNSLRAWAKTGENSSWLPKKHLSRFKFDNNARGWTWVTNNARRLTRITR